MAASDPDDRVLEFLAELVSDRAAGHERPLSEYLARFPGGDAAIASAYAEVVGPLVIPESAAAGELGPYRLLRELGRGGQAVVWLALDTRIGREIALKVTARPPGARDLGARLRREAQVAARLSHPGLCPIFDVGADERQAWIAMRFIAGETLEARLARGGDESLEQRLLWIERVALALHAAHEAGIVHRDVKPGNVMIEPNGQPVVLDFGIARDDDGASLTLTGDALGTPAYMAPEQLRGERIDRRADVWALGVVAYELIARRRPFEEPTRERLVRAILEDEPADVREFAPRVPRDLAVVLATALEKSTERRYQSAKALADELARLRNGEPVLARPLGAFGRLARWSKRNTRLAASLTTLAVVLVATLFTTLALLDRTRDALERRDALVRDVGQLSDQTLAADLQAEVAALWPAAPATVERLRAWTGRARALLDRRGQHVEARAKLATRTDLASDPQRNEAARAWLLTQLDRLLESLAEVERELPSIEARLAFASTLRERTVDAHAGAWAAAAERVRTDARFAGFELAPQVGLVPLGPDSHSRLEEFAHLASGQIPARDATGRLEIDGESAIVLVLVPGGEFELGSVRPDATHAAGSPHVDPWTGKWDGPLVHVRLEPCFLGKFELTRGQVRRHAGRDPSTLVPDEEDLRAQLERLAVETISWELASQWLGELGLELPTEAQWEHAARAGTTSVFFTGDDVLSLQGFANVADATAARSGANWPAEPALDDGFVSVAPVGSLAPNPFGLHDMLGNVSEWCRDSWEVLDGARPRDGDGLIVGEEMTRVLRGGAFSHAPTSCRSSSRNGAMPSYVAPVWGARAARRVER